MRSKFIIAIAVLLMAMMAFTLFVACDDTPETPNTPDVPDTPDTPDAPDTPDTPETPFVPTASEIVAARKSVVDADTENYDFFLNIAGTLEISGISQTANANYEGKYRLDRSTDELAFYRETSGLLLYDSQEYITRENDNRLTIKMNEDGEVTKAYASSDAEDELALINLPFVALIDALDADNITDIAINDNTEIDREFVANMQFSSDNESVSNLLDILQAQGTSVDIKDATFTNPQGGVKLYFDMVEGGKLTDFEFSFDVAFPVKGVPVSITVSYSQDASDTQIVIPSTEGFITDKAQFAQELDTIADSIEALKAEEIYSIEMTATNDFDPAWNKLAITDSYQAVLFKNQNGFNHSYMYDTADDGKFEFVIGNIADGTVYIRNSEDEVETITGQSADSAFDSLVSPVATVTADDIACIVKTTTGNSTVYTLHLSNAAAIDMQSTILELLNGNTAKVTEVDNYFNSTEYTVEEAYIEITVANGKFAAANLNTEFGYYPVDNIEYADDNATLIDTIEIAVNGRLDDATDYEIPEEADGGLFSDKLESQL